MNTQLKKSINEYFEVGFTVVPQLIALEKIRRVWSDFAQIARQQLDCLGISHSTQLDDAAVEQDLGLLLRADVKRYLATLRLASKLHSLADLFLDPKIVEFTKECGLALPFYSTTPVFHLMSSKLRIPGGYFGFEVHQDWTAIQTSLDVVIAWIPILDVHADCYSLDLIPGSHLKGLLSGVATDHVLKVDESHYDLSKKVTVEARQGDVVFMTGFTLHKSGDASRDGTRISASFRYENAAEPCYVTNGYPAAQKRTVERALIVPDFPKVDAVKKVFKRM